MRIPGLKRLRLGARWLRSRWVGRAAILGYHRIAEERPDPFGLCVSSALFAEQLEVLRRYANPVSLPELTRTLERGDPPRGTVAVTFDDGYTDLLFTAKPLLERYDVPATAFLIAGCLGVELWWDVLERILRKAGVSALEVFPGGEISDPGRVSADSADLLPALSGRLRLLPEADRRQALEELSDRAGARIDTRGPTRTLAPDEAIRLGEGGLIEVGAHSLTHPILTTLSSRDQRFEITESKRRLEELLGRSVRSFSYPHGYSSPATADLVRQAGFVRACGSANDVAWRGSDVFDLPRFWVRDWDGARFSRWLKRWLGRGGA